VNKAPISALQWNSNQFKIYSDLSTVINTLTSQFICPVCQAMYDPTGAFIGTNAHTTFGTGFTATALVATFTLSGRAAFTSILTGECRAHEVDNGAAVQAYLTSPTVVTMGYLTIDRQYVWSCEGY
jgi:hypothetical protein